MKFFTKVLEKLELSIIYFISILKLSLFIQQSLGFTPDIFIYGFPFIDKLLQYSMNSFFLTSDKALLFNFIILELCIYRSIIKLPHLVKFNLVLGFILEMCQNLVINIWDLLINRELNLLTVDTLINIPQFAIITFFSILFLISFSLHTYAFIFAMFGKLPVLPGGLRVITDSVAFWLKFKRKDKKN